MTGSPRVAAVIVHFGDPAPTRRCLDALDGIEEVILVDQPPSLCGSHPRITTRLEPGANIGFAAASNRGVAAAHAPFVLLLNNDAVPARGSVAALTSALDGLAPDVAGACLKLLCMDSVTIQSAGGLWFTADGIGFPHGFGETDRGQYDSLADDQIGVPSGAAALYRTEAWRAAGGMCEEFFCYCEDGDLGLRMVAAGGRFAWLPGVVVHHELSSSSGAHSSFKIFHVERNHFATLIHTAPLRDLAALPLRGVVRLAGATVDAVRGRGAGGAIAREQAPWSLASTMVRAWYGALRMMPAAVARRRALLRAHPAALRRVGSFLATRRVPLSQFIRLREAPPMPAPQQPAAKS